MKLNILHQRRAYVDAMMWQISGFGERLGAKEMVPQMGAGAMHSSCGHWHEPLNSMLDVARKEMLTNQPARHAWQ